MIAVGSAVVVFALVFAFLTVVERLIHHLRHNPDTNYRWGVWLFAALAGLYALVTSLGR